MAVLHNVIHIDHIYTGKIDNMRIDHYDYICYIL